MADEWDQFPNAVLDAPTSDPWDQFPDADLTKPAITAVDQSDIENAIRKVNYSFGVGPAPVSEPQAKAKDGPKRRNIPGTYDAFGPVPSVKYGPFTPGAVGGGMLQAGLDIGSLISRVLPLGASGDDFQHAAANIDAERAASDEGLSEKLVRGTTRSLMPMVVTSRMGLPQQAAAAGPIVIGAGIQGSQSLTEARDQGLPEADARRFALQSAVIEGASEAMLSRFFPTVEKAITGGLASGLKPRQALSIAAKALAAEAGQEVATEAAHVTNEWLEGVSEDQHTPGNIAKRMAMAAAQSALMTGGVTGPGLAMSVAERSGKYDDALKAHAESRAERAARHAAMAGEISQGDQAVARRPAAEKSPPPLPDAPLVEPDALAHPDALGPRLDKGRLADVAARQAAAPVEEPAPEGPPQEPATPLTNSWLELPKDTTPPAVPGIEAYVARDGKQYVRIGTGESMQDRMGGLERELQQMSAPELNQFGSQYGLRNGDVGRNKKIDRILQAAEKEALTAPVQQRAIEPPAVVAPVAKKRMGKVAAESQPIPAAPLETTPAVEPQPESKKISPAIELAALNRWLGDATGMEPDYDAKSIRAQLLKREIAKRNEQPTAEASAVIPAIAATATPIAAQTPVEPPVHSKPTRKPVTRAAVARTFPGAEIREKPNGWTVKVGQSYIDIDTVESIAPKTPADWKNMEASLGRPISAEQRKVIRAAGSFSMKTPDGKRHDGIGLIKLAYGHANDGTLRHEALHLAKQAGLLKPEEWNSLVKEYGDPSKTDMENEESVAAARASWTGAKSVWDRITSWLRRMLASMGVTPRKAADVMQLLDESGFWQRRAKGEMQGQLFQPAEESYQPARPDLANIGETPEKRELVDEQDAERNEAGKPAVLSDAVVQAEAHRRLDADKAGERTKIREALKLGRSLDPYETVMAKALFNEMPIGTTEEIIEAKKFHDGWRETGATEASAFRLRADPIENPAERMRRLVKEHLLTPPQRIQQKMDDAKSSRNQGEIDRLNKAWADKIAEIKAKLKTLGIDLDSLNEWGYSPNRVAEVTGVIDPLNSSTEDKFYEYWRSLGLLSATTTQTANIASNLYHGALHFAAELPTEALINTALRREEGAQLGELPHVMAGILPGISRGARHAMTTWRYEKPSFDLEMNPFQADKYDSPRTSIPGKAGNLVRIPFRGLSAADQFFTAMYSEMLAGARAYRIAKAEGFSGRELSDRIADLTSDIQSEAWKQGYLKAEELTFKQPGTKAAQGLKRSVLHARNAVLPLKYLVPFVTFPINLAETAIHKSPLGAVNLPYKMWDNWSNGRPVLHGLTEGMAQQAIASMVVLALLSNDEDDPWITGSASQSERKTREMAERTGRQPQSIKLGDKWYSYARIEPFATILATTVDSVNGLRKGDVTAPFKSLIGQISDKTFLSGMSDIMEALQAGPLWEERVGKYVSNFAVSWVPNIIRSAGRSADNERQQRGVWGKGSQWWGMLMQRAVQKTEAVPTESQPIYDLWGRKIPNSTSFVPRTDWLYRMTVPSTNRKEDVFVGDRLYLNWNMKNQGEEEYPPGIQNFYQRNGKTVHFTDEQFANYSRIAGKITKKLVESEEWNTDAPAADDLERMKDLISDARTVAKNAVIAGEKPDESEQGIALLAASKALQALGTPRPASVPKDEREKGVKPEAYFKAFNKRVSDAKSYLKDNQISRDAAVSAFDKQVAGLERETRSARKRTLIMRMAAE